SLLLLQSPSHHPPPHSFPTRRSSDLPALRVYVARPSAAARASAEAALRPGGLQAEQVVGVELWSADRVRLLTVGDPDRWTSSAADRKSTRLNSSHRTISYAVFCLKKK